MSYKYNVVAIGSRDYYQVPMCLIEHNCLKFLITDFYSGYLTSKITNSRHVSELQSKNTISLVLFFILQRFLNLVNAPQSFHRLGVDFLFGFLAAIITWLTTNRAVVYSYYVEGFVAFYRLIGKKPSDLICFQVHPSPWYINKIINADLIEARKIGYECFDFEIESSYDDASMLRYMSALNFCDSIVCASSFTCSTISEGMRPDMKIGIVPYGSKLEVMSGCESSTAEKIRLVTVCQLSQRKGMHWAFEAMKRCGLTSKFDWIIVASSADAAIVAQAPANITFSDRLTDVELCELFLNSDLFIMPSLLEGFGLVYIEALSKGLPIVYTNNTGPTDFCVDGVQGFKVRPGCVDDLILLFQKIADGSVNLRKMRGDCLQLANCINWVRFRDNLYEFIEPNDGCGRVENVT